MNSTLVRGMMVVAATLLIPASAPRAAELLMFDDPGCVWCKRWSREIGPGYPYSAEGRSAPLRRLDIRNQAAAGVHLARPVTFTPTFVLVEQEEEVGRIAGYPGRDFFYPALSELMRHRIPPKRYLLPPRRSTTAHGICASC